MLFNLLWSAGDNLSAGRYAGGNGTCCSTILGANGVGKTYSLLIFAEVASAAFPSVIVVYVSYNNVRLPGSPLQTATLLQAVYDTIKDRLPALQPTDPCFANQLLDALSRAGMKLLLLVEDVDELYRTQVATSSHGTLAELALLGSQARGVVAAILCGSSAHLSDLVNTNASAEVRRDFPLLYGAPNLNPTKFLSKRVYAAMPVDLETVAAIAGTECNVTYRPWLRLLAFAAGSRARTVCRMLSEQDPRALVLQGLAPDAAVTGHTTLASSNLGPLWTGIMDRLLDKNRSLFDSLVDSAGSLNLRNIASVEWETSFQPLTHAETRDIWQSLILSHDVDEADAGRLADRLRSLSDRGWLTLDGAEQWAPARIFPVSLLQVAQRLLSEEYRPTALRSIVVTLHSAPTAVTESTVKRARRMQALLSALQLRPMLLAASCVDYAAVGGGASRRHFAGYSIRSIPRPSAWARRVDQHGPSSSATAVAVDTGVLRDDDGRACCRPVDWRLRQQHQLRRRRHESANVAKRVEIRCERLRSLFWSLRHSGPSGIPDECAMEWQVS